MSATRPLPAPEMTPNKILEYVSALRHAMDKVDARTNAYRTLSELRDWLVEECAARSPTASAVAAPVRTPE